MLTLAKVIGEGLTGFYEYSDKAMHKDS